MLAPLVRPLAVFLAALLTIPSAGWAEDLPTRCDVPAAPGRSVRLRLAGPGDHEGAPGYWYSDAQVTAIANRIQSCEKVRETCLNDLGKSEADRTIAEAKSKLGWKFWTALVAAGVAAGFAAGKAMR